MLTSWMLLTLPRQPSILRHRTTATSGDQPGTEPPASTLRDPTPDLSDRSDRNEHEVCTKPISMRQSRLSCLITQCYQPPDTGGHRLVLNLPTPEGRKAELTRYRVKLRWNRNSRFLPYDSVESLEFVVTKFGPAVKSIKDGYLLRNRYFTAINSSSENGCRETKNCCLS